MSSVNNHIIVGNLGKDPESSMFQDGTLCSKFTVATSKKWKDRQSGEMREHVNWHSIMAKGKKAEVCQKFLKKGMKVYISGEPTTRVSEDEAGKKHYYSEVILQDIVFLSPKSDASEQSL